MGTKFITDKATFCSLLQHTLSGIPFCLVFIGYLIVAKKSYGIRVNAETFAGG